VKPILDNHSRRPQVLDADNLRSFWDWEWRDYQGRRWQVIMNEDIFPFSDVSAFCRGTIEVLDGVSWRRAGFWERKIHLERDSVDHDNLHLEPQWQGNGFAQAWLEHSCRKYKDWGLEEISIPTTGYDGASVWLKSGFSFYGEGGGWDSDQGVQTKALLEDLLTWPDDEDHYGYRTRYQDDPAHQAFRKHIGEMLNGPQPPRMEEVFAYPREYIAPLLYDVQMALRAHPDEVLNAINLRRERRLSPGQVGMDLSADSL
jgi:GNAT superfamily N-acetyltransferase